MPTYEYRCSSCGESFVQHESLAEHAKAPPGKCPHCGSAKIEQSIGSVYVKTSKKS